MKGDYVTDIVKKTAEKLNCRYLENASMRDFTSFKTGGNADIIVFSRQYRITYGNSQILP